MQRKRERKKRELKKRGKNFLLARQWRARAKGQRNIPVTEFFSSPLATSSLYIKRNGGMALTVQMFGVGLVRPEGLLVNEGIRAGKVRDGRRVELPI